MQVSTVAVFAFVVVNAIAIQVIYGAVVLPRLRRADVQPLDDISPRGIPSHLAMIDDLGRYRVVCERSGESLFWYRFVYTQMWSTVAAIIALAWMLTRL